MQGLEHETPWAARWRVAVATASIALPSLLRDGWTFLDVAASFSCIAAGSTAAWFIERHTRRPLQSWLWLTLGSLVLGVLLVLYPALDGAAPVTLVTQALLWLGMVGIAGAGVYWLEHIEPHLP